MDIFGAVHSRLPFVGIFLGILGEFLGSFRDPYTVSAVYMVYTGIQFLYEYMAHVVIYDTLSAIGYMIVPFRLIFKVP